jgi:hypothetical protein
LIDFPKKISGIQISRFQYGNDLGCSYCFPHGFEVVNARKPSFSEIGRNTGEHNGKTKQVP